MGDPKKARKKYKKPSHPWQRERIDSEKKIVQDYGLKNKKEIMKNNSEAKRLTSQAKKIIKERKKESEQIKLEEKQLLDNLYKFKLLNEGAKVENALSLTLFNLLERRLQTIVHKKGLARTSKQSRQLIVHGHISINNNKVSIPSYLVSKDEEEKITYNAKSSFSSAEHPERVKGQKKSRRKGEKEEEEKLGDEFKEVVTQEVVAEIAV